MIDIHSHILPAVDDGSKSMEESLAMLKIAAEEGIDTMIATPHNMPGKGCHTKAEILDKIEELTQAALAQDIHIKLLPGTEYFYREEILPWLEDGSIVTLADTKCVLIEFDPGVNRRYVKNAVREVLAQDYIPVIAHVERYADLITSKHDFVEELRQMGAKIQVNTSSIMGSYGFKTRMYTRGLLKNGLVDFIGTDAHSTGHRSPRMKECAEYLRKKYAEEYAEELLNAGNLHDD